MLHQPFIPMILQIGLFLPTGCSKKCSSPGFTFYRNKSIPTTCSEVFKSYLNFASTGNQLSYGQTMLNFQQAAHFFLRPPS